MPTAVAGGKKFFGVVQSLIPGDLQRRIRHVPSHTRRTTTFAARVVFVKVYEWPGIGFPILYDLLPEGRLRDAHADQVRVGITVERVRPSFTVGQQVKIFRVRFIESLPVLGKGMSGIQNPGALSEPMPPQPNGLGTNDRVNNVEVIDISSPATGAYIVTLSGYNIPQGSFPISEEAAKTLLCLPMHPFLIDEEVQRVVDTIREFFN